MKEIDEMFSQYSNHTLTWIVSLKKLKQLEDEGKIILFADTYSFKEALKRPLGDNEYFLYDSAYLYFYSAFDKKGYCF